VSNRVSASVSRSSRSSAIRPTERGQLIGQVVGEGVERPQRADIATEVRMHEHEDVLRAAQVTQAM
jgi:hypothetical protein